MIMVNRFSRLIGTLIDRAAALQHIASQCILCAAPGQKGLDLCLPCQLDLPALTQCCQQCALPLFDHKAYCGQCLLSTPAYQRVEAPWLYQPPIAQLISRFKYSRQYSIGKVLSNIAARRYASAYIDQKLPDLIVPIPLHWSRQTIRGFNQSEHLARYYSHHFNIPMKRFLKRCRPTAAQQMLTADQRRSNMKGAFQMCGDVAGKLVAVVDDVMTTGTTVSEASQCLLKAGATEVHIWCLARTE
ncbi:competence protein ComF, putative [marine gamma proteobacterium HTCC2143]|jgi:ComF family protein|uniref:Competence protein ComF, putative n=1 Tax=marine gamma proteobacterium HTCC2143 TaxID=247633 RepID=A0Y8V6_9GAMM|nr:competence protein ComF, putative [marine gamma proteobacterium HTCC2143]